MDSLQGKSRGKKRWVYGPVLSRRFGLSLGVDLVPEKLCSYDCIYCQLGGTTRLEIEPSHWVDVEDVVRDVCEVVEEGGRPDVVTLAGSGEPTLYDDAGLLIKRLRETAGAPVLMLTNGGMFFHDSAVEAAMKVDILAPSLDAGDPETFRRINRPHPGISFEMMLEGLQTATRLSKAMVRLEVMLVKGVNDSDESIAAIVEAVKTLRVDRIDVNTPVRPVGGKPLLGRSGVENSGMVCPRSTLEKAAELMGPAAVIVASSGRRRLEQGGMSENLQDVDVVLEVVCRRVRETISRRPCTASEICDALGFSENQVLKALASLRCEGVLMTGSAGELMQGEVVCREAGSIDSEIYYFVDDSVHSE